MKATLHWVSAADAIPAEVRLYEPLFKSEAPDAANFAADLSPASLELVATARLEPALAEAKAPVQFERLGYFCPDPDSAPGRLVFNRTVGLRDPYAKAAAPKVAGAPATGKRAPGSS